MPAYENHQDVRPAYIMATDPVLDVHNNIQPGILWIDTDNWHLYVRDDTNLIWELLSGAPSDAHYVTTQSEAGLSAEVVLGTGIVMYGVVGSRPSASISGRLYYATDEDILYRDNSSTWDNLTLDWAQITGKPTTFNPVDHIHDTTGNGGGTLTPSIFTSTGITKLSNVVSASLNGNKNDWAPTGIATKSILAISPTTGGWEITGLDTTGNTNRVIVIFNSSSVLGRYFVIRHESVSSVAANRFNLTLQQDLYINSNQSCILWHNGSKWIIITSSVTQHSHLDGRAGSALDASVIVNTPAGDLVSIDVQSALNELDTEKAALATVLSQAFNAGDFTSDTGTFVLASGDLTDFSYSINGKVMTIWVAIDTATITGTPGVLKIKIPDSKISARVQATMMLTYQGGPTDNYPVLATVTAGGTDINLYRDFGNTNWAAAANTFSVRGQIMIEIQ